MSVLKVSAKNKRKILKILLLSCLHQLFSEKIRHKNNSSMEYCTMDSKIIQFLIQSITETELYTLEGIAYHTHIPFDVIYDAACGINRPFSITSWARIIDLYLQVQPDIAKGLVNKLLEISNKNSDALSSLLHET